jgi:hypothetical protein
MTGTTFVEFYKSDLQSVYALCVVPLLLLGWLLFSRTGRGAARSREPLRRFLYLYCIVFAVETLLDPVATGPFTRWIGASDTSLGTAILLLFVLLGDFRVYLLVFFLAWLDRPFARILAAAAGWTFVVPIAAYAVDTVLHRAKPGLPEQTIWLVYELAFLAVALWLRSAFAARNVPASDGARGRAISAIAGYAAVYYALWASADVLILVFGLDAGWALRAVPNQLYYAWFLPFVWLRLSSLRPVSAGPAPSR